MNTDYKPYEAGWLDSFTPPIPEIYGEAVSYLQQIKKLYLYVKENVHQMKERLHWLEQNVEKIGSEAGRKVALQELQYLTNELNRLDELMGNRYVYLQQQMMQMRSEYTSEYNRAYYLIHQNEQKITDVENQIPGIVHEEVSEQLLSLQVQIRTLENLVHSLKEQVHGLTMRWGELNADFLAFKLDIRQIIEKEFERVEQEIEEQISRTNADSLLVTSALTGKTVTLKAALQELVGQSNFYPIKCSEFDNMKLTVEEFDGLYVTANMFDSYSGLIFFEQLHYPTYYDILDYVRKTLQDQIDEINNTTWFSVLSDRYLSPYMCYKELAEYVISQHSNRISAADFDQKNILVSDFDKKLVPVVTFDLSGGNIAL